MGHYQYLNRLIRGQKKPSSLAETLWQTPAKVLCLHLPPTGPGLHHPREPEELETQ